MRSWLAAALLALALQAASGPAPAAAAEPRLPGQHAAPYHRWSYPAQIPGGPLEEGTSAALGNGEGFLTLPFMGSHYVTAIFDHCAPTYVRDGRVCRFDGAEWRVASAPADRPPARDALFYDGHDGIDYGLYYENVAAAADGVVSFAGWDHPGNPRGGFGQFVLVDHGNGITTRYAHLQTILAGKGDRVRRGEVIGISGNTGSSSGEHLHWGVYRTEGMVPVDPYGWAGQGPDPWPHDVGNLWRGGAPRFAELTMPRVEVAAELVAAAPGEIEVRWNSQGGGTFEVQVAEGDASLQRWLERRGPGTARFRGLPGRSYWFRVTVLDDLGWTSAGRSAEIGMQD